MKRMGLMMSVMTAGIFSAAVAEEPDWANMGITFHSAYQAINTVGVGTFPLNQPVKMRGVLLNLGETMLNTAPGTIGIGGQWQVVVQAIDSGDFGGTFCWMGQNYAVMKGDPDFNYTVQEWLDEMQRISTDPATGRPFLPGDMVEIRARAPGLFRGGKTNINEKHDNDPINDFDLVLLEPARGIPASISITLESLKDSADNFIFDYTRQTGCERYQGEIVEIQNVSFVSTAGWAPETMMTIQDNGSPNRTFTVKLCRGSGFSIYPAPTGTFNLVGIMNQENSNTAGYQVWALDYNGSEFVIPHPAPGDFNYDGHVDAADFDHFSECYNGPVHAVPMICLDADMNNDQYVDAVDFDLYSSCYNGPVNPPRCQ